MIDLDNDEIATVRDTMRSLNRMVAEIEAGERQKYVLFKHGKMVAVLIPIDEYMSLTADRCDMRCDQVER